MPENVTNKDRLRDITASIEAGIKDLFQSDKYAQYLATMSRFHKYSVNNTMLIFMQRPDATLVCGFNKWRDQFERNVLKGEKGIKIIAPMPYKKKIEQEKFDPDTKLPMLNNDGKIIKEEKEIKIPMYKPVTVFDVGQTAGKPLPQLASDLTGDVQNYDVFMEALKRSAPVPIAIEPMTVNMDGFFSLDEQRIAVREGMSEIQTVSATIHEIAHSKLHNTQKSEQAEEKPKSRETEELEAESISFSVCAYYGIKTDENSFGYLASYSRDKELSELKASLETINKTSSELITDIDRNYAAIMKERGLDKIEPEKQEQAAGTPEITVPETESVQTVAEYEYKLHANPRSADIADAAFIQVYQRTEDGLVPGEVLGFGAYADFIPLTNRLNDEKALPEDACPLVDAVAYTSPAEKEALSEQPFSMPDPTLTIKDMHSYGYTDGDMLPVSKERARELMGQDVTIYGLKQGDRFVRVSDPWKVNNYDGMLGINTDSWTETWKELPPSTLHEQTATHEESVPIDIPAEPQPEIGVETPPVTAKENPADPAISVESMNAFGYTDADMLPLTRERAMELLERDVPIYMLYDDNTEAMAFEKDELIDFGGMLGVTKADWALADEDLKIPAPDYEQAFRDSPGDAYVIYQLADTDNNAERRFMNTDYLEKKGLSIDRDRYTAVYGGELLYSGDTYDKLNGLYERFNNSHPLNYKGHSLSISDVVALKQDGAVTCHYVDSWDFKELPTFLQTENYLKNAEMATEDDYGMIDGVINNGVKQPTVAELEQQAKSGQPISLMDLAAAVKREQPAPRGDRTEKKASVLEQLRSHKATEPPKSKKAPVKDAEL